MGTETASPHLYVALSPHGYGHAAITTPVLNRLRTRFPSLRLTIETNVPRQWLTERLTGPFDEIPTRDFGMVMHSATRVDANRSHAAYLALHADWPETVTSEANRLRALRPDAMLANIPHLALAAAARAGIPAVALCSLNWAGIYRAYCGDQPGADRVLAQMEEAYGSARTFLRTLPAMPMPCVLHARDIGPIVRHGCNRRDEVRRFLGVSAETRLGLLAFGGIDPALALDAWPRHPGWVWMAGLPQTLPSRPDMVRTETLPWPFIDLLYSSDVVLTKPGYGTFTEAACAGVAVLHSCRNGWPEAPPLSQWLREHARALIVPEERLRVGAFAPELEAVLTLPQPTPPQPTGI
ncbi:MAG: hypothetical protein FD149_981, partial [Rhodospirillaceae bacterium]